MGTDIHGFLEYRYRADSKWSREVPIERSRNYRIFAALADVRNGYGFAGVPTHAPIKPISLPRGLPEDHTTGYGEDAEYEFGDHSFSWLSMNELLGWDGWDQQLREQGIIDREHYEGWLTHKGVPTEGWAGGISGMGVIIADHPSKFFPEGWTHISVSWSRSLRESCSVFLAWLNYAKELTQGAADARIVFGFDS